MRGLSIEAPVVLEHNVQCSAPRVWEDSESTLPNKIGSCMFHFTVRLDCAEGSDHISTRAKSIFKKA